MAHSVTLNWDPPAGALPTWGYNVFRGTAPGKENATPIATAVAVGATAPTWTDTDPALVEGQTYYYYVETENGTAASVPSNEASATIPFVVPGAPQNLKALAV